MLQLVLTRDADSMVLTCYTLAGHEVLLLKPLGSELASDLQRQIAEQLNEKLQNLHLVLPDGQLLTKICSAHPAITVADLSEMK